MELRAELDYAAERFKAADDAAFVAAGRAHREAWDGEAGTYRPDRRVAAEVERDWLEWVSA